MFLILLESPGDVTYASLDKRKDQFPPKADNSSFLLQADDTLLPQTADDFSLPPEAEDTSILAKTDDALFLPKVDHSLFTPKADDSFLPSEVGTLNFCRHYNYTEPSNQYFTLGNSVRPAPEKEVPLLVIKHQFVDDNLTKSTSNLKSEFSESLTTVFQEHPSKSEGRTGDNLTFFDRFRFKISKSRQDFSINNSIDRGRAYFWRLFSNYKHLIKQKPNADTIVAEVLDKDPLCSDENVGKQNTFEELDMTKEAESEAGDEGSVGHQPTIAQRLTLCMPRGKVMSRVDSLHSDHTSASNHSSIESLIRERETDIEQMLTDLGFGGIFIDPSDRIPRRFLVNNGGQPRTAAGEFTGSAHSLRNAAIPLVTMSAPVLQRNVTFENVPLQPEHNLYLLPRSILHPENTQALMAQGFYDIEKQTAHHATLSIPKDEFNNTEDRLKMFRGRKHTQSLPDSDVDSINFLRDSSDSNKESSEMTDSGTQSSVDENCNDNSPIVFEEIDITVGKSTAMQNDGSRKLKKVEETQRRNFRDRTHFNSVDEERLVSRRANLRRCSTLDIVSIESETDKNTASSKTPSNIVINDTLDIDSIDHEENISNSTTPTNVVTEYFSVDYSQFGNFLDVPKYRPPERTANDEDRNIESFSECSDELTSSGANIKKDKSDKEGIVDDVDGGLHMPLAYSISSPNASKNKKGFVDPLTRHKITLRHCNSLDIQSDERARKAVLQSNNSLDIPPLNDEFLNEVLDVQPIKSTTDTDLNIHSESSSSDTSEKLWDIVPEGFKRYYVRRATIQCAQDYAALLKKIDLNYPSDDECDDGEMSNADVAMSDNELFTENKGKRIKKDLLTRNMKSLSTDEDKETGVFLNDRDIRNESHISEKAIGKPSVDKLNNMSDCGIDVSMTDGNNNNERNDTEFCNVTPELLSPQKLRRSYSFSDDFNYDYVNERKKSEILLEDDFYSCNDSVVVRTKNPEAMKSREKRKRYSRSTTHRTTLDDDDCSLELSTGLETTIADDVFGAEISIAAEKEKENVNAESSQCNYEEKIVSPVEDSWKNYLEKLRFSSGICFDDFVAIIPSSHIEKLNPYPKLLKETKFCVIENEQYYWSPVVTVDDKCVGTDDGEVVDISVSTGKNEFRDDEDDDKYDDRNDDEGRRTKRQIDCNVSGMSEGMEDCKIIRVNPNSKCEKNKDNGDDKRLMCDGEMLILDMCHLENVEGHAEKSHCVDGIKAESSKEIVSVEGNRSLCEGDMESIESVDSGCLFHIPYMKCGNKLYRQFCDLKENRFCETVVVYHNGVSNEEVHGEVGDELEVSDDGTDLDQTLTNSCEEYKLCSHPTESVICDDDGKDSKLVKVEEISCSKEMMNNERETSSNSEFAEVRLPGECAKQNSQENSQGECTWQLESSDCYRQELDSNVGDRECRNETNETSSEQCENLKEDNQETNRPQSADSEFLKSDVDDVDWYKDMKEMRACQPTRSKDGHHVTSLLKIYHKLLRQEITTMNKAINKYRDNTIAVRRDFTEHYSKVKHLLNDDERDDVKQLETLHRDILQEVAMMESALKKRAKVVRRRSVNSSLTRIKIIQQMIELLGEQLQQRSLTVRLGEAFTELKTGHSSLACTRSRFKHDQLKRSFNELRSGLMDDMKLVLRQHTETLENQLRIRDRQVEYLFRELHKRKPSCYHSSRTLCRNYHRSSKTDTSGFHSSSPKLSKKIDRCHGNCRRVNQVRNAVDMNKKETESETLDSDDEFLEITLKDRMHQKKLNPSSLKYELRMVNVKQ